MIQKLQSLLKRQTIILIGKCIYNQQKSTDNNIKHNAFLHAIKQSMNTIKYMLDNKSNERFLNSNHG